MASREFRILGSGTCSTRIFFLPIQQVAFIVAASSQYGGRLGRVRPVMNAGIGPDDFPGFQHLLEAAEIAVHLLARLLAEELRDRGPELADRRLVAELDVDLGAAATRRRKEPDDAPVG